MSDLLVAISVILFVYFAVYNLIVFTLLAMSYGEMSWLVRAREPRRRSLPPVQRPAISVLVPAYNEREIVVSTVWSLLGQDYPRLEVVVIDDGSTDDTIACLDAAFHLVALPVEGRVPLPSAQVRSLWVSRKNPNLIVLSKENGGRADALNAALGFARHELVAVTDADGVLERDALARLVRAFEEHPDDCVAAGGQVRVVNTSRVVDSRVDKPRVGWRGVDATQVMEYLRGFLGTRIAWSRMNGLLIVSGGFGVFRRDTLVSTGGFLVDSLGEDMEVTVRLHHELRPGWPDARVTFVPDAVCWTQAPSTLKGLRTQRIRWQVGLIESIRAHREMLVRRRYGAAGLLAMPYVAVFEALSPLLELAGYLVAATLLIIDLSYWPLVAALFTTSVLFGQVQSMIALLVEEVGFRAYGRVQLTRLLAWSLLECLWYRPLLAVWRTEATIKLLIGRRPGWGKIKRLALDEATAEAVAPLTR
jgi:cellulose synthase/poly-beta-1,6-N-acetylglucosamine synthase-like glycosyltransferase